MYDVAIEKCDNYDREKVYNAIDNVLKSIDAYDLIKPGMCVVIKANLVSFLSPEKAATTHPTCLCELTRILREHGAKRVIIGDSPGGFYNSAYVGRVYLATGVKAVEKCGGELNRDFSEGEAVSPSAVMAIKFMYTKYLDSADLIIDFCKLKTHGMMGMSAAVKNMFGVIPGTFKPEYHYLYHNYDDFARMLIDLNEHFRPQISIADAVTAMEGNGPTMGDARHVGAILASRSPYALDLACCHLIGLNPDGVPTVSVAAKYGLCTNNISELTLNADINDFAVDDFKHLPEHRDLLFNNEFKGWFGKAVGLFISFALESKPKLKKSECAGCKKCYEICPAKAITMKKSKPTIDRKKCISCFCCQEFCPVGAMKVKRPLAAKIINRH